MKYTVDYFIQKFEAIPEDNWIRFTYRSELGCCALGWCKEEDFKETTESSALIRLIGPGVAEINDDQDDRYQQPNPKARILAALYDIKDVQLLQYAYALPKKD